MLAPLDPKIHVVEDSVAVQSLGAWIGNNIKDLTPWEAVLDKIMRKLEIWVRFHPTIYGKRLISKLWWGGATLSSSPKPKECPHTLK